MIRRPAARQSGFSLIEVLVAVLVISIGVLGVAGLQLLALRNNTAALLRTQAFQAGYDIMDRARANPGQSYAIAMGDAAPAVGTDCLTTACTPAEMRDFDLNAWLTGLAQDLPSGDGSVVINGDTMTVTVRWQESREAGGAPLSVAISTEV